MSKKISDKQIDVFHNLVYAQARKREADFPWRKRITPYAILVSEIMLQQTQAERVVEKFNAFMELFPTIERLANASHADVLKSWQGLGYNRRALMLQRSAQLITKECAGKIPRNAKTLETLPGIGSYTASAIMAFAFNKPAIVLETNIRRVYIHHFFQDKQAIRDKELISLIERTIDGSNPRKWYSALMDYGAILKLQTENPNRKSAHYAKQSPFKGSLREVRGAIVRQLLAKKTATTNQLCNDLEFEKEKIKKSLDALLKEDFLERKNAKYGIKQ